MRRRRAAGASGSGVRGVCVRRRGTEGLCDKGVCRGRVARASGGGVRGERASGRGGGAYGSGVRRLRFRPETDYLFY